MFPLHPTAVLLALVAVLLAAVLSGCSDDKTVAPLPPSEYLEQSSPENVLANLRTAYEERDCAEYAKLFAADFVFVFHPEDANDPTNPTPADWPFPVEVASACSLFAAPDVQITILWSVGPLEADSASGCRIRVDDLLLNVYTRNENNELWIYQVRQVPKLFFFREDTSVTFPGGKHRWFITRWEEVDGAGLKSAFRRHAPPPERTTWGQIKMALR